MIALVALAFAGTQHLSGPREASELDAALAPLAEALLPCLGAESARVDVAASAEGSVAAQGSDPAARCAARLIAHQVRLAPIENDEPTRFRVELAPVPALGTGGNVRREPRPSVQIIQGTQTLGQKASGTIRDGRPIVLGEIPPADIERVFIATEPALLQCYANEVVSRPELSGRISIKVVIDKHGAVSMASVRSTTMHDSAVEQCLIGQVELLQFPQSQSGGITIVTYPLSFPP